MDVAKQRELLEACRGPALERRRPLGGDETHVPVSLYLDPERFVAERALQRRSLNLVAHSSELPTPGRFLSIDVGGTPVLLVRGNDGVARAFLNVCRHRGARVERRASGHCKRFVCPYHAWTYHTDGTLAHVRHPEGFPSVEDETISLTALACVEEGPFLWVCPTPGLTPPLDDDARGLVAEIEGLGLGGLSVHAREGKVWTANWKLLVEGGLESYHFKIAHRGTVGPLFTDTGSVYTVYGDHLRSVLPRTSVSSLSPDDGPWSLLEHANVLYTFSPNASILAQDGHFAVILMTPLAIDQTRIDLLTVGRPAPEGEAGARRRAFLESNHAFTVKTLEEDFALAEEIQRGLATGANDTLRFGRYEDALTAWHQRLDERLAANERL